MTRTIARLGVAVLLTCAALVLPSPSPAGAATCAFSNPMYSSPVACARVTWNEGTGVMCWSHQLLSSGFAAVWTESKLSGQSQWRHHYGADQTLDSSYRSGCTPRRGSPGAVPRPTDARVAIMRSDGRMYRYSMEIVLVG